MKWEGDSLTIIRSWPKAVKENIGGDLQRIEKRQAPLDHKFIGNGTHELRDEYKNINYGLLYWLNGDWVYILHCFVKKTQQTPKVDIELASRRKKAVIEREDRRLQLED